MEVSNTEPVSRYRIICENLVASTNNRPHRQSLFRDRQETIRHFRRIVL